MAAGQDAFVNAQGRSGRGYQKRQRGEASNPFGTVCPLSVALWPGPELLRLADRDTSVSAAISALRPFSSLSCSNVFVVQLTFDVLKRSVALWVRDAMGGR
jgi:hypothetical protein